LFDLRVLCVCNISAMLCTLRVARDTITDLKSCEECRSIETISRFYSHALGHISGTEGTLKSGSDFVHALASMWCLGQLMGETREASFYV